MATEFLPICDNLFNVISLAAYFCDCVFDIVLGYALLERGRYQLFAAVVFFIVGSLIVSQIVSLRWYFQRRKITKHSLPPTAAATTAVESTMKLGKYSVIGAHVAQLGVIWRYAKLFIPVDLRFVKHDVRDLCILRLIHGFCEAAPMLLIQAYILMTLQSSNESLNNVKIKTLGGQLSTHLVQQSTIVHQYQQKTFKDLNTVSAILSLFSVCWALASFSKNVRVHNVHRLVLTWLGVIFQFFWRLGTVTSRVLSLTAYASVYKKWIFLVIVLHWISMFLWLISPKNAFHGEQISKFKKMFLSALVAFIYIFAYINLQEVNHKQKMMIFYIVMFLENCMLVSLWTVGMWPDRADDWYSVPLYMLAFFFGGILIMIIYYKYFHIRRLGYEAEADDIDKFTKCGPYSNVCQCTGTNIYPDSSKPFHQKKNNCGMIEECCEFDSDGKRIPTNEHLRGVFNCRFSNPVNNATKRKKKKPTSFIPPPVLSINGMNLNSSMNQQEVVQQQQQQPQVNNSNNVSNGPMAIPFWRQPLPPRNSMVGGSSETEGSVASSRINIQLKLQEKKQKQLAELKIIEEEIKQGKLGRQKLTEQNEAEENGKISLPRQPAPVTKKHIDLETMSNFRQNSSGSEAENMNILLHQLQQNNDNVLFNNFSTTNSGIAAALSKFSHEILTNINIGEKPGNNNLNTKPPSGSSTLNSTTSENENNSLTRQMVSSRKKLLHHNLANNLNVVQSRASPRIASPSCHYDPRAFHNYNSLEGKSSKTDTNRSSNSKNNDNSVGGGGSSNNNVVNSASNSIEKDKSLASQLIKRQMARGNTPEILLSPNHLDSSYANAGGQFISDYRTTTGYERAMEMDEEEDDSQHIPSDIDSQMSLPRSYTLPREFKFNRQGRKMAKSEHFVPDNNSSDGDVDSCDDNEFENDGGNKVPISQRMRNRRTNNLNKHRLHANSPFRNISPNIMTQKQYQSAYNNMRKVNNLDLINDCIESRYEIANQRAANARRSRSRMLAQHSRHETKF